uniref:Prefoldin subunit 2 n=1 Tax=Globodera pallida TaxID=36090 RepID=A0A183CEI0_GLOPA
MSKNAAALQQADAVALKRPFDAHKVLQQTLLKLEEYQNEQRQNQKEICVQIGELKKLVGPGAGTFCLATELITQAAVRANVVASGEEHRKLLTELEALRAQMAEVKGLHKMQEQREAQINPPQ